MVGVGGSRVLCMIVSFMTSRLYALGARGSTMKIELGSSCTLDIPSPKDLLQLVPEGISGEVLNYGQSEGQVRIGETVWGAYLDQNNEYYLQFEEGNLTWSELAALVEKILEHLRVNYRVLDPRVIGVHHGLTDV